MTLIIPLLLSITLIGATWTVNYRVDMAQSLIRKELAQFISNSNLETLKNISEERAKKAEKALEFTTKFAISPMETAEKVSLKLLDDFSEHGLRQKYEERVFVAFFQNAVVTDTIEYGRKPLAYFPYENDEWIMTPSLRALLAITKNKPPNEIFMTVFLFSEIYAGEDRASAKNAKKTWDRLRNTELSVSGMDSLGMFSEFERM